MMSKLGIDSVYRIGSYSVLFLMINSLYLNNEKSADILQIQFGIDYGSDRSLMTILMSIFLYTSILITPLGLLFNKVEPMLTYILIRDKRQLIVKKFLISSFISIANIVLIKVILDVLMFGNVVFSSEWLIGYVYILGVLYAFIGFLFVLYLLKVEQNYIYLVPIILISTYLFVKEGKSVYAYGFMISCSFIIFNIIASRFIISKYERI